MKKLCRLQNVIAVLLSLFALLPLKTLGQVDPSIEWKKMSLPHFDLIYDARHQNLANIYAARLEYAMQNLKNQFTVLPEKTAVVLEDRTDLTNGAATAFPYPLIQVFPVLPSPQESIGEFGDWSSELVTHEYTHILAMYQRRDVVDSLSSVFGSIMIPNLLLPRWWHEGSAVEMETRYSNAGRLRSTQQDAWIRSYFDNETNSGNDWDHVRMGDSNEVSIPTWPYGARPYLFGSLTWSEILADKPNALKELSWAHGGRAPYIINFPAENILGVEYPEYFRKMKATVAARVQTQFVILNKIPPTLFLSLNLKSVESFSPAMSPDGRKMAFIGKDETLRRSIQILERPSTQVPFDGTHLKKSADSRMTESSEEMKAPLPRMQDDGPPGGVISRLEWFPDSKKIIYDKIEEESWFHDVSDLYSYDTETSKTERLTYSLRAREASVSPDGRLAVFVKILPGKTDLQLFDFETKRAQELFTAPLQTRCSHPTFINAHEIIFSFRENGKEQLVRIDLRSPQKIQPVLSSFTPAYYPEFVEGKLFFISTASGVPNLYLADSALSSAQPQTHTLTGISQSTFDNARDEIYVTQQTAIGLRLSRVEKAAPIKSLPKVSPLFSDRYPANLTSVSADYESQISSQAKVEDYSSLGYLLPRYWFPFIGWDNRATYLTFLTSGTDPLEKHAWTFFGLYNFTDQYLSYNATYTNFTTSAQISTLISDMSYSMPTGTQHNLLGHIEALWQLLFLTPQWQGSFGWSWSKRNITTSIATAEQSGPSLGLKYFDYTKSGVQISPESGVGGSLTATYFQTTSKTQPNFNQIEGSLVKYWSKWLPERHAVMTRLQSFYIDQPTSSTNYAFTSFQPSSANSPLPQYLARAYPTGEFIGKALHQATLEYRFPIKNIFSGWNTKPVYIRQLHAAVIADGVAVDGYGYDLNAKTYKGLDASQNFWSVGIEAHLSTTIGYHFPFEFYYGYYLPTDTRLGGTPFTSLGIYL